MSDSILCAALRRFFITKEAISEVYQKAWAAYSERSTEVVITSVNFVDGSSSGQIGGDPREIMIACELMLQEIEAKEKGECLPFGPVHSDFSRRRVGT